MRLLLAMQDALLVVDRHGDRFDARLVLDGYATQALAWDRRQGTLYCATFDRGLWRSDDGGDTWRPVPGIAGTQVTAVAVGPAQRSGEPGVVYAGTEPSKVFRSQDGGSSWVECVGLTRLPSSTQWSFPPRPDTHHVRWITPDPAAPGKLYVAIEAGALVRSEDGGETWGDRVAGGPYDTHSLVTTPAAHDHLHSAAGDGYFESVNAGATWRQPQQGLTQRYLWSVAIDRDSTAVVVSAASGPFAAHRSNGAESALYRRMNGGDWTRLENGLPPARGTTIAVVAADPERSGGFLVASNHGIYRSNDCGASWEPIETLWPERFRAQRAAALLVLADAA